MSHPTIRFGTDGWRAVISHEFNNSDGVKYLLEEGNWLPIRPSGTEPVLRIYAEARSRKMMRRLLRAGAKLAGVEK